MMQRRANDADAPSPEQLAAYLDGELDPVTRARVAAWLSRNGSSAEFAELRRLNQLWQDAPCPEPSEAEWDVVLEQIVSTARRRSAALPPLHSDPVVASAPARRPRSAGVFWHLRMAGTAAAILFLTLMLYRPTPLRETTQPVPQTAQLLRVAGDDDVDILSMDAGDIGFLVVGEPPLRGPFVLAAPGDVVLESIVPDPVDGMMPQVGTMQANHPDGPMIMAPLSVASNR